MVIILKLNQLIPSLLESHIGPGLAAGNMIAASSANKNFKNELMEYDINGKTIKKGETVYGLIGLDSYSYGSIKVRLQ